MFQCGVCLTFFIVKPSLFIEMISNINLQVLISVCMFSFYKQYNSIQVAFRLVFAYSSAFKYFMLHPMYATAQKMCAHIYLTGFGYSLSRIWNWLNEKMLLYMFHRLFSSFHFWSLLFTLCDWFDYFEGKNKPISILFVTYTYFRLFVQ